MKFKYTLLLLSIMGSFTLVNAQKYMTKNGVISFHSKTKAEDIKAENRSVVSVIDIKTGAMEFQLLMKGFDFPNDLMEQHFNESYAESDKYPKATFKGKIDNIDSFDLSKNGTYTGYFTGKLTIKNVTKEVKDTVTFVVKNGKISATSNIKIKPKDFNFNIPATAVAKIEETIRVEISMNYTKK